ncbi:MAG TPA: hypothetical protein VGJ53_06830 [Micromonosporaceae bacterium]
MRWPSALADPQIQAPAPPDNASFAKGINDSGVVGGDGDLVTDEVFHLHAALWDRSGSVRVLDGVGGPGTKGEVFEVNNLGQAAGDSLNTLDYGSPGSRPMDSKLPSISRLTTPCSRDQVVTARSARAGPMSVRSRLRDYWSSWPCSGLASPTVGVSGFFAVPAVMSVTTSRRTLMTSWQAVTSRADCGS